MTSEPPVNLVGNVESSFPNTSRVSESESVAGQGQTKLGSLAVVKTLGLNPTLNKQLKTSVSSVSPKVVAVRKSFEAVGGIVERFSKHEADQKLLEHWKSIENNYAEFLHESSNLAKQGAIAIGDFIDDVIPYLNSNADPEKKRTELISYCKTLEAGQQQARNFSKSLDLIATAVNEFKDLWQQRIEGVVVGLKDSIRRLELEIRDLAKSICDVKGNVSELRIAKCDKKDRERMKKMEQQEIQQRYEAERLVEKHANTISSNTDGLRVVWNLIYDDLYLIENHLKITASGAGNELFQKRLAKLPEQYVALKNALEKYSVALSKEPDKSEKSFGVFSRLRLVFH